MSTQALILAAAVALGAAANAQAATVQSSYSDDQLSARVSVADLDLRKDAGAVVALHRIRGAARMVCSSERLSSGFDHYSRYRACVAATSAEAAATLRARFDADPSNGQASTLLRLAAN